MSAGEHGRGSQLVDQSALARKKEPIQDGMTVRHCTCRVDSAPRSASARPFEKL
jgi:hypothetical protein